jgi:tryptophan halogenase
VTNKQIKRVVIAGGGTAGWMAAALLGKTLGRGLDICLVESDDIGTIGVGEATIPPIIIYNRLLDLNEQKFMAAVQGTFKLGIEFANWRVPGESYFHSFGSTGTDHWTAGFQHFWLRGRERGLAGDYGDYCLELKAALAGRFAQLPNNGMNYAFHIDAGRYARYLREFSESFGVRRIEGKIVEVHTDPGSGEIASLHLDGGQEVAGDLFIDCSGFRGLLIEQTLHAGFDDWSHWLPCDSAVAVQTQSVGDAIPYTRSTAREAGWQWRIPLQHRVGNGHVYCSRYLSDAAARETLLANVEGKLLTEPKTLKFHTGQRRRHWVRNCVAIGLAGGFIEPLESTAIHLIQRSLIRLMQMFPHTGIAQPDMDEFNRQTRIEFEHIRDFIVLHYHLTERDDTPFWRHCRSMQIPETLAHRIRLFRETGRVFRVPNELFAENSWIQVMMGQGIVPEQHHPAADLMDDAELGAFLGGIKERVDRTVAQLPTHQAFVDQYCPAGR